MRIAIVGPGSMGLLFACRLAQAGADVFLLDYKADRAKAISADGIVIEDDSGSQTVKVPVTADPARLAEADLALVCVKAYRTAEVAVLLAGHLPPSARAMTVQNGAGNVEILAEALGPERVLGGITSEGANILGPGHVRHAGRGLTHVGPMTGETDDFCTQVNDLLARAGFDSHLAEGVQNLIWTKLVINVGINPLTAILDVPNGQLVELEASAKLMELAVAEAVAVGKAKGVTFLQEDMLENVREVARRTAKNVSSMRADVLAKRQTEVEFINGIICRAGAEASVPTPVNEALTLMVKAIEDKNRQ